MALVDEYKAEMQILEQRHADGAGPPHWVSRGLPQSRPTVRYAE